MAGEGGAMELWLVFVDEGISLQEWLYSPHVRRRV